jgi:plasmid stabilization system protein ParE
MIFQVRLQSAAVEDLNAAFQYAASHAPVSAERWLGRFKAALKTLEHNPERCPLAAENSRSQRQLREFLFGKRPFVFRVIFTVDRDCVRILRICRAQRRPLKRDELGASEE